MNMDEFINHLFLSHDEFEIKVMEWWSAMGIEEESRIEAIYHQGVEKISSKIGNPYFQGAGERHNTGDIDYHNVYFDEADQALQIALWDRGISIASIMLTGHDADTLKTIQICQLHKIDDLYGEQAPAI
jgi:hypothetical protein